jgi:WhiB family redox-sensing transcriptional regulator
MTVRLPTVACESADPEMFFPPTYGATHRLEIAEAKALCRACGARQECLAFAVDSNEQFGIWGGATPTERQRVARTAGRNRWRSA